mmetsp:Transcript_12264/g.47359  ORF Transcript_12264/g.47359 Transcript_12264/m.47359 type:complete len:84 (+) Transcript_12264:207-458(+)
MRQRLPGQQAAEAVCLVASQQARQVVGIAGRPLKQAARIGAAMGARRCGTELSFPIEPLAVPRTGTHWCPAGWLSNSGRAPVR